jgi:hypothetical protein
MEALKSQLSLLPSITVGNETHLSYQAVTDTVAAFLFPTLPPNQIDDAKYQQILETAVSLCCELGYPNVEKLSPPDVPLAQSGLYFCTTPQKKEMNIVMAGSSWIEMMQGGLLFDARLSQLGLDEVTRQHFKIPVTASDGLIDLMHRAVASKWPNDYKGIWHDVLGMCIAVGKDISPGERLFTVIIRGVGRRRYWQMKALVKRDHAGNPYLSIRLVDEPDSDNIFELGHVVMTTGAAALDVDFAPFLARHAQGDWGDSLDSFDRELNDTAVKEGYRILSAYGIPIAAGGTEPIWIITEADRSVTTVMLPSEY